MFDTIPLYSAIVEYQVKKTIVYRMMTVVLRPLQVRLIFKGYKIRTRRVSGVASCHGNKKLIQSQGVKNGARFDIINIIIY